MMGRAGKPDSSVAAGPRRRRRFSLLEDARDKFLRLSLNPMQMIDAAKTLRVYLVNLFGARRSRRDPSALRAHLDSADCRPVAGRNGQCFENFLTRKFALIQLLGGQLL